MPFKRYNIFLRSVAHLQNSIENISLNFGNNSVHMNMIAREICSWISGYLTQQSFGTLPNWGPRPIVPMVTLAKMTALVLILGFSDTLSQKSPLAPFQPLTKWLNLPVTSFSHQERIEKYFSSALYDCVCIATLSNSDCIFPPVRYTVSTSLHTNSDETQAWN